MTSRGLALCLAMMAAVGNGLPMVVLLIGRGVVELPGVANDVLPWGQR